MNTLGSAVAQGAKDKLRKEVAAAILSDVRGHPVWRGKVMCSTAALDPDLVRMHGNDAYYAAKHHARFGYDNTIVANPAHTSIPLRSCHLRYWGSCRAERLCDLSLVGTFNIYALLKRWEISREDLPRTIRVETGVDDFHDTWLIGDFYGKGATVMVCKMKSDEPSADSATVTLVRFKRAVRPGQAKPEIDVTTSQVALTGFFRSRFMGLPDGSPEDVDQIIAKLMVA